MRLIANRSYGEEADNATTEQHVDSHLFIEASALAIVALVSIFGNLIVSLSLVRRQQLVTPSNRLVLSLTASNFAFSILVLPFVFVTRIQQDWIFGVFWCNLNGFITLLVSIASTVTLAMIAIDRYLAIVKPMMYVLKMTNNRAISMLMWIWIQAFVFSVPPFLGWSRYEYDSVKHSCLIRWDQQSYYASIYIIMFFILPLATMITCYYLIFQVARTKCRRISVGVLGQTFRDITPTLLSSTLPRHHSSPVLSFKEQRKTSWTFPSDSVPIKGIWTICMIFGSFVISYTPYVIDICLLIFAPHAPLPSWFTFWSLILFYSSAASYAFIYGLYNRSIRKELKAFLFSKSSDIFQGLPSKHNMKRASRNCSLIDFNMFKLKSPQSALHLSQFGPSTSRVDLSSLWRKNGNARKDSQDSGAVMTIGEISDTEMDSLPNTVISHYPHRRCSAPSSFLYNDGNPETCRHLYKKPQVSDILEVHRNVSSIEDHTSGDASLPDFSPYTSSNIEIAGPVMTIGEISDTEMDSSPNTISSSNPHRCCNVPSSFLHRNRSPDDTCRQLFKKTKVSNIIEVHRNVSSADGRLLSSDGSLPAFSPYTSSNIEITSKASDGESLGDRNSSNLIVTDARTRNCENVSPFFIISSSNFRSSDEGIENDCVIEEL